eukprot:10555606-Alexandrium_andersonii.AAC.1
MLAVPARAAEPIYDITEVLRPIARPKVRKRGTNWPDRARIANVCRARSALTMRLKPATASSS